MTRSGRCKCAILIQKSACLDLFVSISNSTVPSRRLFRQHRPKPEVAAPDGERVRAVIAAVAISSHVTLKLAAMRGLSSSSVSTAMLSRKAGGVSSVLKLRKSRSSMRPWIAMVAAYALALQVLLSGLAGAHAMAAGSGAGDLFVICHGSGDGPADGQNVPDQSPRPASPCVLCTLTQAAVRDPADRPQHCDH